VARSLISFRSEGAPAGDDKIRSWPAAAGTTGKLDSAKVRIFDATSNDFIDMSSLGGRVKHTQLAAAAEIFRMVTSEKVKKAYERNKKQGKPWGRKAAVWDVGRAR